MLWRTILFRPSCSLQVVVVLQQVFQLIQKVLSKWLNDAQVVEVTRLLRSTACSSACPCWPELGTAKDRLCLKPYKKGVLTGLSGPVLLAITSSVQLFLSVFCLHQLCSSPVTEALPSAGTWGSTKPVLPKGRPLL